MGCFENGREHITRAVVPPAVITVGGLQQLLVGVGCTDGGAERKRRIEAAFERAGLELQGSRRGGEQAA
ncbi:hypothetical protein D3C72_2433870 [compost metagenome]